MAHIIAGAAIRREAGVGNQRSSTKRPPWALPRHWPGLIWVRRADSGPAGFGTLCYNSRCSPAHLFNKIVLQTRRRRRVGVKKLIDLFKVASASWTRYAVTGIILETDI